MVIQCIVYFDSYEHTVCWVKTNMLEFPMFITFVKLIKPQLIKIKYIFYEIFNVTPWLTRSEFAISLYHNSIRFYYFQLPLICTEHSWDVTIMKVSLDT